MIETLERVTWARKRHLEIYQKQGPRGTEKVT